jgi:hypothetical protein
MQSADKKVLFLFLPLCDKKLFLEKNNFHNLILSLFLMCRRQSSTIQASLKNPFDRSDKNLYHIFVCRLPLFASSRGDETCPKRRKNIRQALPLECFFLAHQLLMICGLLDAGT